MLPPHVPAHRSCRDKVGDEDLQPGEIAEASCKHRRPTEPADFERDEQHAEADDGRRHALSTIHDEGECEADQTKGDHVENGVTNECRGETWRVTPRHHERSECVAEHDWRRQHLSAKRVKDREPYCDRYRADQPNRNSFPYNSIFAGHPSIPPVKARLEG